MEIEKIKLFARKCNVPPIKKYIVLPKYTDLTIKHKLLRELIKKDYFKTKNKHFYYVSHISRQKIQKASTLGILN